MKKVFSAVLAVCLMLSLMSAYTVNAAVVTSDGSFEQETEGTVSNDTAYFSKDWAEKNGLDNPSAVVSSENGNKYLTASGLLEIQSVETVSEPYTFSVDLRTQTPMADWLGIFIRTGDVFNLYEWDFYAEKGGTEGTSSIGAGGIVIYPVIDGIRLAVKTQADGPWGVSCLYTDILVEGNPDWKNFTNLKVEDDGATVKIYIGGSLTATVEMSEKGTYEEDASTEIPEYLGCVYYKNVVVKDSTGAERFRTDRARVVAEDAYLGIGVREKSIDIDNISISVPDQKPDDQKPDDQKPDDQKPDDQTPDDQKPDDQEPDGTKPDNPSSGDSISLSGAEICAALTVVMLTALTVLVKKKSLL